MSQVNPPDADNPRLISILISQLAKPERAGVTSETIEASWIIAEGEVDIHLSVDDGSQLLTKLRMYRH